MTIQTDFSLDLTLSDIPDDVIARAEDLLLDTIGVAASALDTDAAGIARDMAESLFMPGDPNHAGRMLFDGRPVSLAGACYASATQIDSLDAHDGYLPVKGHAGVALVPAVLHFADAACLQRRRVTGADMLSALIVGYEIACRAGAALHATVSDYHTSGAWNALGVAAIGARLLGLSKDQLRQAWGIAEYHGPRSQMMREIDNPSMLHDGSGWGALAGTTAVILAQNGYRGAPAVTIEREDAAPHWQGLGTDWLVTQQYVKPHPVCFWAQSVVTAALRLRERHGVSAPDIDRVTIETFHESARLSAAMPRSTAEAQYSLAFPTAAALVRNRCGPDEVKGSGLSDPDIEALLARISVSESDAFNAVFPNQRFSALTLHLKDGRVLESGPMEPRGAPTDPLSRADIVEKFYDHAEPVLGLERTGAIRDAVFGLKDRPDPGELLSDLLVAADGFDALDDLATG